MIVGVDVGFSSVKVVANGKRAIFPSVVGTPMPEASYSLREENGLAVRVGEGEYIPVGETAMLQSRYTSGRRDSAWVLDREWLTLFIAAISEVVTAPHAQLKVITGLPVYDWQQYCIPVRDSVQGVWPFQRSGRTTQRVEIEDCLVVTQPYGSLLSMGLGPRGELLGNDWCEGLVAVADLGGTR